MAVTAAMAWVWSGVETTTASSRGPRSWSSSRKSAYFLASLCFSPWASSRCRSMSQMATSRPCRAAWSQSPLPLPPTPMQAMLNSSLGLAAQPRRPGTRMPNPATDAPNRNDRRFVVMFIVEISRPYSPATPAGPSNGPILAERPGHCEDLDSPGRSCKGGAGQGEPGRPRPSRPAPTCVRGGREDNQGVARPDAMGPEGATSMRRSRRIGLFAALAILGSEPLASAQAPAQSQPAPGSRPASIAARPASPLPSSAARRPVNPSYQRLTSTTRRASAYARPPQATGGAGSGAYAANDPFRPYSTQARRSAAAISPTRVSEAPPPPPQPGPLARYDYYPGIRIGQHPNATAAQVRHHCTPSRGGVMAGSLGRGR